MNKPEVMGKPEAAPEIKSGRVSAQPKNLKMSKDDLKKKIKSMRDRDAETLVGIFRNFEHRSNAGSTGTLLFSFKMYPGEENAMYELQDGERYALPRGVVRHIKNNCYWKEYVQLPGEMGRGMQQGVPDGKYVTKNMQASRKVHRFGFDSLEFMDDDHDLKVANLIEVTVTP